MVCTSLFMCGKDLIKRFYPPKRAVKHVQSCLDAREDRESSFHSVEVL